MLAKAFVNSARVAMALYSAIVFILFVKIRMEGGWILIRITVGGKDHLLVGIKCSGYWFACHLSLLVIFCLSLLADEMRCNKLWNFDFWSFMLDFDRQEWPKGSLVTQRGLQPPSPRTSSQPPHPPPKNKTKKREKGGIF